MLKQISSLGKTLNKAQQKEINGGFGDDPFIGSGPRPGSCPTWLFEGIERPCGTSAGSFRSECISTPSGNECRIFSI